MGSKSTTKNEVPKYIEEAGKLALQRAQELQGLGYMPYMGPEVAAINPYEQAMSQNVGSMASAFGMAAPSGMDMGGMPTVTQGGMTGYSSYPTYMGALEQFQQQRPDQYAGLAGMTQYDPITGMMNPDYNAPTMDIGGTVAQPSRSSSNDDPFAVLREAEAMRSSAPSSSVYGQRSNASGTVSSSPRPVMRGSAPSGGGLLSGIQRVRDDIRNSIYTGLGGRG